MAENQTRTIVVKTDFTGDREIQKAIRSLASIRKEVGNLSQVGNTLRNAFNIGFAGFGIGQITDRIDAINLLRDRINVLSGGVEQGAAVFDKLANAANRTKTGVENLSVIYSRLAASTKSIGLNTDQLIDLTETLQNSFRLSGSTAQEATSAAIQLSQGFASGQLRGQELRSVLEANVALGDALARQLGLTRGEILKFAEAGNLTANKVLKAIAAESANINAEARKLDITFGQVFVQTLDRVSIAAAKLSKDLGLAQGLANVINSLAENIDKIVFVSGVALITFLSFKLPAAIAILEAKIYALATALFTLTLSNPITAGILAGIAALTAGFLYFADTLGGVGEAFDKLYATIAGPLAKELRALSINLSDFIRQFSPEAADNVSIFFGNLVGGLKDFEAEYNKRFSTDTLRDRLAFERAGQTDLNRRDGGLPEEKLPIEKFTKLNNLFKSGAISLDEYAKKVRELEISLDKLDFDKGKKDVFAYREEVRKLKEIELNEYFKNNSLTLEVFNQRIADLKIEELNDKFRQGKIGAVELAEKIQEVNDKLNPGGPFETGVKNYLNSIGSLSEQIAGSVTKAFESLEDALVTSLKTGKASFEDFGNVILDSLFRIYTRALIIKPLIESLSKLPSLFLDSGLDYSGPVTVAPGLAQFASGGIVGSTTPFMFGNKLGVMGERGPEAILPLTRTSSGDLGVQATAGGNVTVNVINNSGAEIQQTESTGPGGEKIIDIIVVGKVKEALTKGTFDRELSSSFGIKRRGT